MKIFLGLAAMLSMLLSGCAIQSGDWFDMRGQPFPARTLQPMGQDKWIEAVSSTERPCDGAKVIYVDKAAGIRQPILEWDTLDPGSSFTLKAEGHPDLVDRIKRQGLGCALVEAEHLDFTEVVTKYHYQADAFVRYQLDGNLIRLQVRQLILEKDAQTGLLRIKPDRFNFSRWSDINTIWHNKPYNGPVALPQVVYRIDKHRFFEVVPLRDYTCSEARLYYTDTALGIHTNVVAWDKVRTRPFIIDAANDQFLVAPIVNSASGCQAGGGDLCTSSLYFSQDAGRTWIRDLAQTNYPDAIYLTGDRVYDQLPRDKASGETTNLNVPIPSGPRSETLPGGALRRYQILQWTRFRGERVPPPLKNPLDTKFNCTRNDDV